MARNFMARNFMESEFVYRGFRCVILFMDLGHRCGYVEIPEGHELYGADVEYEYNIDCHGGITFCGNMNRPYFTKDAWVIGFNCAHCMDGKDIDTLERNVDKFVGSWRSNINKLSEWISISRDIESMIDIYKKFDHPESKHVWTNEEVSEELMKIVDQIVDGKYKEED